MRPKVFVVEGKNDFSRLKQLYPDIFIIITNGSEILKDSVEALIKLDETHDIILFLDPDYAGKRIRHQLASQLKHIYHAFIEQDKAHSKNHKKIGVEHAKKEDIEYALKHIKMVKQSYQGDIDIPFLYDVGLLGQNNSKHLRHQLTQALHIGHVNGKTLFHRLKAFGMTQKDICEVITCNTKQKRSLDKTF